MQQHKNNIEFEDQKEVVYRVMNDEHINDISKVLSFIALTKQTKGNNCSFFHN